MDNVGKIIKFSKTNITEDYYKWMRVNNSYKGGKKPRKLKNIQEKNQKAT